MKTKICVLSSTRADYGIFYPILREIKKHDDLMLQLVLTGTHLDSRFGSTMNEVVQDRFEIAGKFPILDSDDSGFGAAQALAKSASGFADQLKRLQPHWVLVLGDRSEILGATCSANLMDVPVAHISGGEVTEGAKDESFRHGISKLSHLHFAAAEAYRQRLIRMGENPERVFNVGSIGAENAQSVAPLSKPELESKFKIKFGNRTALITFHPVTNNVQESQTGLQNLLAALKVQKDLQMIFTMANADAEGNRFNQLIGEFVAKNRDRATLVPSLGREGYLSAVHHCDVIVGNSSSGIIEVPVLGKPTVNIGSRQAGRLRAPSVIDTGIDGISDAIKLALSFEFQKLASKKVSPYLGGHSPSKRIVEILKGTSRNNILVKPFHDQI